MKLLKRANTPASPEDEALVQRLGAVTTRGKVETAFYQGLQPVPAARG